MFEIIFKAELTYFTTDKTLIKKLWSEIGSHYNKRNRHYHNLLHLDHLLKELIIIKDKLIDWQIIVFSIAYHDIIYNALKKDNEEKSADIAYERLGLLNITTERRYKCRDQILATKSYKSSTDNDINYFTDSNI